MQNPVELVEGLGILALVYPGIPCALAIYLFVRAAGIASSPGPSRDRIVWSVSSALVGICIIVVTWLFLSRLQERMKTMGCYAVQDKLPEQSMDHSSLRSKYHDLGVIGDTAFEKLSTARKDA